MFCKLHWFFGYIWGKNNKMEDESNKQSKELTDAIIGRKLCITMLIDDKVIRSEPFISNNIDKAIEIINTRKN